MVLITKKQPVVYYAGSYRIIFESNHFILQQKLITVVRSDDCTNFRVAGKPGDVRQLRFEAQLGKEATRNISLFSSELVAGGKKIRITRPESLKDKRNCERSNLTIVHYIHSPQQGLLCCMIQVGIGKAFA